MILDALKENYDLFRPVQSATPTGAITYTKAILSGVKLGGNSQGISISTDGQVQANNATLYYNVDKSTETPTLSPILQAGDIIAECSNSTTPPVKYYVVKNISTQYFKGVLHHYEAVL